MSSSRADHPTLGYLPPQVILQPRSSVSTANTSPTDPTGGSVRSPFGNPGVTSNSKLVTTPRSGAGSPSHELGGAGRLYSKRAREIQAQEGVPLNVWGPPTSGNSTPLRENIPESPTDGFPDYMQLPTPESQPQSRRARAGTVPSRFSPGGLTASLASIPSLPSLSSLPTPTGSPYKSPSPAIGQAVEMPSSSNNAALLSRLRAGSMPQKPAYGGAINGPFGPSVFSTNWASGRERASTLVSIASLGSNVPSSPAQSVFSKEGNGESDMQMRTLDYLGLADSPQPARTMLPPNSFLANVIDLNKQANRFRSYSVNAKERYAADEDDEEYLVDQPSGTMSPYAAQVDAQLQYQIAQTNAAIQQHNLAVQAYATQASTNRPRARTAGVLDSPSSRLLRTYYPGPSRLDNSVSASDISYSDGLDYDSLPKAIQSLGLNELNGRDHLGVNENALEGPTSALWLGNIPSSTTMSTLSEMFKAHGQIHSVRVLTHKNCGFVNFEQVESAISARATMNGKEIFPGAGAVKINFAKPPSASGTPGHDGLIPSPSPDPLSRNGVSITEASNTTNLAVVSRPGTAALHIPTLEDMQADIIDIVKSLGATEQDQARITQTLQHAGQYDRYVSEIPPVQEPSQNRVHDAPKLREIRKRIDNNSWSQTEIESIALDMLPEVAELASDYLGNTVVQKLFEYCSNTVRDAMLAEIAPHMAEIGVHKNGTWAAQKIIDVAKSAKQMSAIVDSLRPYTVPLFLDQFGNYVLQCCLKFGSPFNDFIFETMLTKMWDIAQGRYGARAMRACLESHYATRDQQRMLAAAIALQSVQLSTNANGALLLTWFLDTCTFPQRRTVLAPRLVPHLVHLCTHKVAYLTVLKVINQRNESEARDIILNALFFSPENRVLEDILSDHVCGATLIFKVLTTPFFDETIRTRVVENVREVLIRLKAQPAQGYKRLMDEVGLSTRNASAGPRGEHLHASRSTERHRAAPQSGPAQQLLQQHQQHQQQLQTQIQQTQAVPQFAQFYNGGPHNPQAQFDLGMQRTDSTDSNMASFSGYNMQTPMFAPQNVQMAPMNMSQMPPQQTMLLRNNAPSNNFYPNLNGGFGYTNINPAGNQFRHQAMLNGNAFQTPSPQLAHNPTMAHNNYGPPGFGMGGFGYGMGVQNLPYIPQQEQVNGRRGRQR